MNGLGKTLIALGLGMAAIGVLLLLVGRLPFPGRLPGDIVVRRPGFTFYAPFGTSLLISLVISLLLWLLRR